MDTFLDGDVEPVFHGSLDTARRRAIVEVANTGGILLEVRAVEAWRDALTVVGTMPAEALGAALPATGGRARIRSSGLGRLHTTWGALLEPQDPIGLLVLHQPVTLVAGARTDRETARVVLDLRRRFASLPSGFALGPRCCADCSEAISVHRLKAVPGARICTKCQDRRERH